MEHLIQFTYSVDDDRISQQLQDMAVRDVIKRFDEAVLRAARKQRGWSRGYDTFDDAAIDFLQHSIDDFVREHADAIINAAGKCLAEKLCRTKRGKELLEQKGECV